ncbi:MAG: hypothetical protein U5O16_40805 [Rhodococcus sp. (in: high G+C Gram-positive bacteria)]|uniref:AtuA-related protein n=1 Tax=Rhodococcus sp. TaxID=1831 RepID=UPI002AD67160|nr:hypothetical protein [Rhodococcus sp. (in: high G+C Gram-positive bacteria)]
MRTVDDLADVRTGDKGDSLILAVFPRTDEDFELLTRVLTIEAVAAHFEPLDAGEVRRTAMPLVSGMVFELPGGTRWGRDGVDRCWTDMAST